MSDDPLISAQELVAARLGLDFSGRSGEATQRRLKRVLHSSLREHAPAAFHQLASVPPESPELMQLARHLTVGETYFFRDHACFQALEHQVLPRLIAERRAAGTLQLRVWSAGCSTGEEPYSLAILLDRLLPDAEEWRLTLLATDINPDSLQRARVARYREWSFRSTPEWVRRKYFRPNDDGTWELVSHIRKRVTFQALNLAEDTYPGVSSNTTAMDLILCRNVLMYFTDAARKATIERLQRALTSGGWLAVAPPETSATLLAPLTPVSFPGTFLFRKQPPEYAPAPQDRARPEMAPREMALSGSRPLQATPDLLPAIPTPAAPPSPPEEDAPIRQARQLANGGKVAEAREVCQTAIQRDPLDVEAVLLLATLCEEAGDLPAAQEALRRALFLDADCALAQYALGTLLLRQGDVARGRRLLSSAARLLEPLPRTALLASGDGVTAGDLLGKVTQWLDTCRQGAGP